VDVKFRVGRAAVTQILRCSFTVNYTLRNDKTVENFVYSNEYCIFVCRHKQKFDGKNRTDTMSERVGNQRRNGPPTNALFPNTTNECSQFLVITHAHTHTTHAHTHHGNKRNPHSPTARYDCQLFLHPRSSRTVAPVPASLLLGNADAPSRDI
jgi:hypothetical protein